MQVFYLKNFMYRKIQQLVEIQSRIVSFYIIHYISIVFFGILQGSQCLKYLFIFVIIEYICRTKAKLVSQENVMKKIIVIAGIIVAATIIGIFVINSIYNNTTESEGLKVGLIMNGSSDDRSWSQSHFEGMSETAQELGIEFSYREKVADDEVTAAVEELIAEDCKVIICNSFGYGEYLDELSVQYPELYFFHASGVTSGENLSTYFGRMYQIRYLSGIAAGLQTETNEIGYVAAFPISEVNRGINAFTLGVRSVNPEADVYVSWTNSWVDDDASSAATINLIENHNIDLLAMHVDSLMPLEVADEHNIMSIGYNFDNSLDYPDTYLTSSVWDWKNFYTPHILECIQGKFTGTNYWEGVDTGIVSLAPFSDKVKDGVIEAVEAERERLKSGTFDVFYGPVYDSEGTLRIAEDESMTDDYMLNSFDWYVEGVIIDE